MGDTVWDGQNHTLLDTPELSNYQTWQTVVRGKGTWTANMCIAQDVELEEKSVPSDKEDIAQTLHERNLLRLTDFIQISSKGRFYSIKFSTKQVMEIFCTEGLILSEDIKIYFKPDFTPIPKRTITFISFLNVPLETEEKYMTEFVKQYCHVHEFHYPIQKIGDIKYLTGTRVYRISNIKEHFPKSVHIFGR